MGGKTFSEICQVKQEGSEPHANQDYDYIRQTRTRRESCGHTPEGRAIFLECEMTDSSHLPPSQLLREVVTSA